MKVAFNLTKIKRFIRVRILHANDSPHRIALGVGIGLLCGWSPAFGLHMLIVFALAAVFRANKFLAFTFVWVSNPFTIMPIYYSNYIVGRKIAVFFDADYTGSGQKVTELINAIRAEELSFAVIDPQFWKHLFELLLHGGVELWIGSIFMGTCVSTAGYLFTYKLVKWYRNANPRRRHLSADSIN